LPNISLHLAGESQLFLDAQPIEKINDLLFSFGSISAERTSGS